MVMDSLLFDLLLLVGGVVALGFFRGWLSSNTTYDPKAGRERVQFEIDHNEMKADMGKSGKRSGAATRSLRRSPKDSTRNQPRRIPWASADAVPRGRSARPHLDFSVLRIGLPTWNPSGAAD
jgi:hypothetical protein